MHKRSILISALLVLFAGCLFQPEKPYYDVYLGGAWISEDSITSCQNPGSRTYISFGDERKFRLTTRFPGYVTVVQGSYSQSKAEIRIEWDTSATSCFTKECDVSDRVFEKCPQMKDSALINKDGRITFRNMLYTRLQ